MSLQTIRLQCTNGTSNKFYEISINACGGLFTVDFEYGPIGKGGKGGSKTDAPVDFSRARKMFDAIVSAKQRKGYTVVSRNTTATATPAAPPLPAAAAPATPKRRLDTKVKVSRRTADALL
jgi:predicted DNA-binding WGR domain protein